MFAIHRNGVDYNTPTLRNVTISMSQWFFISAQPSFSGPRQVKTRRRVSSSSNWSRATYRYSLRFRLKSA